jgi:hypothetical protein
MGHKLRSYLEALFILTGIKGEKVLKDKADKVRQALLAGASFHKITHRVVKRAQEKYENWIHASISQLISILNIHPVYARALVSEHCEERTRIN